jgi:hypothetical protein
MARRVSALYASRARAEEAAARLTAVVPDGEPAVISEQEPARAEQPGAFDRLATMLVPDGAIQPSGYLVSKDVAPDLIEAAAIALEPDAERVEIAAPPRLSEQAIELSETAEELVVEKRAVVREEIVMRVQVKERVEDVIETVRRTEVDVERFGPAGG